MSGPNRIAPDNEPLSEPQRSRFRQVAEQSPDPTYRMVGLTLYNTGISPTTMAHLSASWLTGDVTTLEIVIPRRPVECQVGEEGGACHECRSRRDGMWSLDFLEPRRIPVRDRGTAQTLVHYFDCYSTVGELHLIPDIVAFLADEAGIERRVTPTAIRHSYGVRLAEMGFEIETIQQVMGIQKSANVRRYGEFVNGFNPFDCGAETMDSSNEPRCTQPVSGRDDRCRYHSIDD